MVLEARKRTWRARGVVRGQGTGQILDICQHILLGCCGEAIGFLSTIGSLGQVEFSGDLRFVSDDGKTLRMGSWPLPAPFHLLPLFAFELPLLYRRNLKLSRVMLGLKSRGTLRLSRAHRHF